MTDNPLTDLAWSVPIPEPESGVTLSLRISACPSPDWMKESGRRRSDLENALYRLARFPRVTVTNGLGAGEYRPFDLLVREGTTVGEPGTNGPDAEFWRAVADRLEGLGTAIGDEGAELAKNKDSLERSVGRRKLRLAERMRAAEGIIEDLADYLDG